MAVGVAVMDAAAENTEMTEAEALHGRIEAALEREVRPGLRAEGGDVELVGVDADRIVQIRLLGSCQGCGGAAIVVTSDIEAKLKAVVPEIRFLEPVP